MKVTPERVDQPSLLPRIMIGASQRDQDVVRTERADCILERGERRLVASLCLGLGVRGEGFEVAEDDAEPLVGLVPRAVGVRGTPLTFEAEESFRRFVPDWTPPPERD
jgi:hypothetical protein